MLTIGDLIDKLTIINLKIWNCEDIKRDSRSSDKQIADATRKTNTLNTERNHLIQCIDEEINRLIQTGQTQQFTDKLKIYPEDDS